jgi:hypothetical protein
MRHSATNLGAISRALWASALNSRAQSCAPVHAPMPMVHGASEAISSHSLPRSTAGRTNSARSASLTPCTANRFLARSTLTNRMRWPWTYPFDGEWMRVRTSHRCASMPHPATARAPRDGEVLFIR